MFVSVIILSFRFIRNTCSVADASIISKVFLERIVMAKGLDKVRQRAALLIPTPEALVVWGISLKALEGRVRRGTIKPVVRSPYGGFNWYKDRKDG